MLEQSMMPMQIPKLSIFSIILDAFVYPAFGFLFRVSIVLWILFAISVLYVIIRLRVNLFKRGYRKVIKILKTPLYFKPFDFIRLVYVDIICAQTRRARFTPYGVTLYCGRQGGGKTISMIAYANWVHWRWPDCIIVANFKYKYADYIMKDWHDFLNIRNGSKGVLFLIDEIHSEYNSEDWKTFPENLLSEISQQRKQQIKICATSQIYSRVVKQIRDQTYSVVQCFTLAGRWTFNREYDAKNYELYL